MILVDQTLGSGWKVTGQSELRTERTHTRNFEIVEHLQGGEALPTGAHPVDCFAAKGQRVVAGSVLHAG